MLNLVNQAVSMMPHQRNVCAMIKRFAGHSKWANIRHTKGLKDAQRSVLFQRLGRMMRVAIQEHGSPDPKSNLKLEQCMAQARRANMPNTTIQNILKTAQADSNKSNAKLYQLEIKGPGGCIILVDIFTDNLTHIKGLVAAQLRKHKSRFADGSARHLFEEKGIIYAEKMEGEEEKPLLETATDAAIDAGAEDVCVTDEAIEFHCAPSSLRSVTTRLEKNFVIISASVDFIPLQALELSEDDLQECSKLLDKLEALPETLRTFVNIA